MRVYGNLTNRILEGHGSPAPEVGMGVTELMYSDRYAGTIIAVLSPRRIRVQRDKVTRTDKNGMGDAQEYSYEPDPNGGTQILTLRKNHSWVAEGDSMGGDRWALGYRDEFFDFGF